LSRDLDNMRIDGWDSRFITGVQLKSRILRVAFQNMGYPVTRPNIRVNF